MVKRKCSSRLVLIATSLSAAMVFTDMTVLGVALPVIQKSFDVTRAVSQWVVTIFLLCSAILAMAAGQLSDIYGHHKVFPIGTVIFVLASLLSGFSVNIEMLIVARALQAIGCAFVMIGSMGLIAAYFDERNRGRAIGIVMGVGTFMMVVAPFIGGALIKLLSWHWIFFINVIFGVFISYPLYLIFCDNACQCKHQSFDWVGFIIIASTIVLTVLIFNKVMTWGWLSPWTILGCIAIVLLAIIFYRYEGAKEHPLVDFSLFKIANYKPGCSIVALIQAVNFFPILFGVYIQNALGYTPFVAGLLLLPSGITLTISEYFGGVAADRYGARLPMFFGLLVLFCGFFASALLLKHNHYLCILPALIAYGVGISFIGSPLRASLLNKTPKDKVGRANAIISGARQIGGVIVFSIVSSLIVFVERAHAMHHLKKILPNISVSKVDLLQGVLSKTPSSLEALSQYPQKLQAVIHNLVLHSYVTGFFSALLVMSIIFFVSALVALRFLES